MRVIGIVGWKNAGKTRLVERLVAELTGRGYSVSTVKHAHHAVDVDQPGTDSFRHRTAGATEVLLAGAGRWALMHENRDGAEPALDDLLARLGPVDFALVEGFKSADIPKIEAHRAVTGHPPLALGDPRIVAVAADGTLDGLKVPVVPLDDTRAIAGIVVERARAR